MLQERRFGQMLSTSYAYDRVGNRLNPPASPYQMVYNEADQLTRWPGLYEYSYYPDGSLEAVTKDDGITAVAGYTYHPSGLLNQATYARRTAANTWDGDSNRVALTINGNNYSFVYDATAGIPAVIVEDDGETSVYYYREPGGALIARKQGTTWRYYHFDELGSTAMLTDLGGVITDRYTYDPWGNILTHTGATEQPYQYVGKLGYYTHYMEPEFKLLQLGVRFYDSEIGRFGQRDPIQDGLNWYGYAENSPTLRVDPSGLLCFQVSECDNITARTYPYRTGLFQVAPAFGWFPIRGGPPPGDPRIGIEIYYQYAIDVYGTALYYCLGLTWDLRNCQQGQIPRVGFGWYETRPCVKTYKSWYKEYDIGIF